MNKNELAQEYPILYQDLVKYYPFITEKRLDEDYDSAIFEKLNSLIDSKIADRKNFRDIWLKGVLKKVERDIEHEVHDLTLGAVPNYGGLVRFSSQKDEKIFFVTEIQFYVSLINDYISINILEMDESTTFNPIMQQEMIEQKLLKLVISPSDHKYNYVFESIEKVLDESFENPKFLPFGLEETVIKDLFIPHTYKNEVTLGDAFFSKKIALNGKHTIIGDPKYRIAHIQ